MCISDNGVLAVKPDALSFVEASALTYGGLTALSFLRDNGRVHNGSKVLILGASGSIGSYAVQLAKHFGAEVTGVLQYCRTGYGKSPGS